MDVDFDKEYRRLMEKNKRIKNEMENIEMEYNKMLQYSERFRYSKTQYV